MSVSKPKPKSTPKVILKQWFAINDRKSMYGITTNCLTQLPPANRILLEKLGVFQTEMKSSQQFITLFTRGPFIQSTTYRSMSL